MRKRKFLRAIIGILILSTIFLLVGGTAFKAQAAVTMTTLTSGYSNSVLSSYTTASITPSANKLILVAVYNYQTTPGTPTLSGNNLTYVQIATRRTKANQTGDQRLTLFRAMGSSPTAGAITISFAGATQGGVSWSVVEFDGVDTSGTNGSGAVVQSVANSATAVSNLSITLAAFGSGNNATFGAFGKRNSGTFTLGTGFSLVHDVSAGLSARRLLTEWRSDNDTTVDSSWSGTYDSAGIGIEIKSAVVNTPPSITAGPTVGYGSYTRTGPNNTPWTLTFTASDAEQTGADALMWEVEHTVGCALTPDASGTMTSGVSDMNNLAYNIYGSQGTIGFNLCAFDGVGGQSADAGFTLYRDDTAPGASTVISHTPNPVTGSKQYSVTFTPNDTLSTSANEMRYEICEIAGVAQTTNCGNGTTPLASGAATRSTPLTTAAFTDTTLVNGANTRYIRTRDGANNWTNTSFTVTASLVSVPTVTTPTSGSVTSSSATLGANVTATGGASITARGTCWGTTANPTTNCLAEGGITTGIFTHSRTGLPSSTLIYYRGYATNSAGTGYSTDGTFTTLAAPVSFGSSINASNEFRGYAWSENIGWIIFNCLDDNAGTCTASNYKVKQGP